MYLLRFGGFAAGVFVVFSAMIHSTNAGAIFVTQNRYAVGTGVVGSYNMDGSPSNASLITGQNGMWGDAVSGNDLFVVNGDTIGEYTPSGATVNASLITGLSTPRGIAISGNQLFVANQTGNSVGEYTISNGQVVSSNPTLVSGLTGGHTGVAVSGSNLFICNLFGNTIAEYTTSGQRINASQVSGVFEPTFIAVSGSRYVRFTVGRRDNQRVFHV